jgi:hypothetical protein
MLLVWAARQGRNALRKALSQIIGPEEIAAIRGEPWRESIKKATAARKLAAIPKKLAKKIE